MPTFEERYTAWIDGQLAGEELAQFERELEAQGLAEAEADRDDAHRLGKLLRSQSAPAMPRADFFNVQLLKRIAAEDAPAAVPVNETPARGTGFWTLPNLAWAAAVCLLASLAIYQGSHPHARPDTGLVGSVVQPSPELLRAETEIINSVTDDPSITATAIHSEKDHMTVLWLDGLDYLPASYQLQ